MVGDLLLGTYEGIRLSGEGLVVPAEIRKALQPGFVMTRGLDHCVAIFPRDRWKELSDRIDHGTTFLREAARMFQRHVYGGASIGSLESDGLIEVPDHLRRYAELGDEVVLVGVATRLEIWNPQRWARQESGIEERAERFSEALSEYGI
ncbi:MAG: hypothetical protein GTO63_26425 [Anaerolineae bacterium]|nr:hypothetical protein [Anaerolineae bacterium]NIN98272.1 hypothetical protein [Anaerolineae bacterium]NIQ81201.1 hypothetical protein [Anaerolineae bacterium]